MAVGYVLETFICIVLVCAHIWFTALVDASSELYVRLLQIATRTSFDTAIFFTFAIQLASCVTLGRANFGMGADGMGAITMKIAWIISTLTLLPLLPLVLRPQMFFVDATTTIEPSIEEDEPLSSSHSNGKHQVASARQGHRFMLFVLCWAVSFYPFFSGMAGTFGASQFGDAPGSAISTTDFATIQDACFGNVAQLTISQENAITAFGAASWLFISIIVIYGIVLSAMRSNGGSQFSFLEKHGLTFGSTQRNSMRLWLSICAIIVFFIVSQLWAFFRLRRLQSEMTEAAGGRFPDGQWTFGQIVGVVGFLPVCAEVVFQGRIGRRAWVS
ncbi:hypothetical protein EK21DRAFT_106071 [Setomelanomma holmii]|uniref:Uncharacterized protein n=1 Tax=Setomelanomma holmii TaxID=210430 RepID=A0A9P4HK64_9PLEO|nr:hypothetical protein EK21DRAFT_106071 [Setomelanomma holmii]